MNREALIIIQNALRESNPVSKTKEANERHLQAMSLISDSINLDPEQEVALHLEHVANFMIAEGEKVGNFMILFDDAVLPMTVQLLEGKRVN